MVLKIVEYGSPDYSKIVEIRQEILRRPLGYPISDEELENESNDIFLATIDNEIIASCILTEVAKDKVQLRQMLVIPRCQGKGIGRELLLYAQEVAIDKGYKELWLHARKTALAFYRKMDYTVAGDEFQEVGIPHYEMYKQL